MSKTFRNKKSSSINLKRVLLRDLEDKELDKEIEAVLAKKEPRK